jgi:hypothetical protein
MLRLLRVLAIATTATLSFSAFAQTQSITFTNNQPSAVSIKLLDGTQVQIGTNGDLTATCQLDQTNRCVGLPSGGGAVPTVSLTYTGAAQVTQNSTITVTASVSNATACVRQVTSGSPTGVWTGVYAPASAGGSVVMGTIGTYGLQLKCYNDAGFAVSNTVPVEVISGGTTLPPSCNGVVPPSGYTLNSTYDEWVDLFPGSVPMVSVSALTIVSLSKTQYITVPFRVPTTQEASAEDPPDYGSSFQVQPAQSGGTQLGLPNGLFYNISRCPGDFRYSTSYNTTNPDPEDPNQWRGCRNWRPGDSQATNSIGYRIVPATTNTFTECPLQPGVTYYLNYILGDPRDGLTPGGEANCASSACVFEVKANP